MWPCGPSQPSTGTHDGARELGQFIDINTVRRHFKPLCERLGIKLRCHDMRRFAVSLWIEQGFSIKEVMMFAGNPSVQMTMERYDHLFPTLDHQRSMAEVEHRIFG